jgi:hypothetical protein
MSYTDIDDLALELFRRRSTYQQDAIDRTCEEYKKMFEAQGQANRDEFGLGEDHGLIYTYGDEGSHMALTQNGVSSITMGCGRSTYIAFHDDLLFLTRHPLQDFGLYSWPGGAKLLNKNRPENLTTHNGDVAVFFTDYEGEPGGPKKTIYNSRGEIIFQNSSYVDYKQITSFKGEFYGITDGVLAKLPYDVLAGKRPAKPEWEQTNLSTVTALTSTDDYLFFARMNKNEKDFKRCVTRIYRYNNKENECIFELRRPVSNLLAINAKVGTVLYTVLPEYSGPKVCTGVESENGYGEITELKMTPFRYNREDIIAIPLKNTQNARSIAPRRRHLDWYEDVLDLTGHVTNIIAVPPDFIGRMVKEGFLDEYFDGNCSCPLSWVSRRIRR